MQAVKFKNFTDEDFTWKWNGVDHAFKAGTEIYLEQDKAEHFAKHLVDHELNKLNKRTDYKPDRARLTALCFPTDEVLTPSEALQENIKVKKAKKKVEKEFEDLNQK